MIDGLFGTAIILAGGESKRFGYPKALLKIGDKTVIETIVNKIKNRFKEVIIVTDQPGSVEHLPVIVTGDIITECKKSSLRGLHAGLSKSQSRENFVIACDMPFVNIALVEYMYEHILDNDVVIPRIDNYVQPLHAFYQKKCFHLIEKNLTTGKFKVSELYHDLKIKYIDKDEIYHIDPEQKTFLNINTYADYEEAIKLYNKEKKQKKVI